MKKEEWILEAENVSYTYDGNEKKALNGVNLKIRRGQRIAFMGGNGSGKSTLFLCMNGIRKPDEGRLLIGGKPVGYTRRELLDVRKKVGIVFQEPDNQLFSASVFQEISFGILNLGVDEKTAGNAVEEVIQKLEITPFRDRPAHALSGGQKKQVAIADILVMNPDIMILDEPAAALDLKHTSLVREIIDGLSEKGITVLIATHDIDYAYEWADEIILMKDGEIIKKGTPLAVCSDQRALEKTNLEMPAVLRLFMNLKRGGLLPEELREPSGMGELEQYLLEHAAFAAGKHKTTYTMAENREFREFAADKKKFGDMEEDMKKKGILMVSFGTSHLDTMQKTIEVLERETAEHFPGQAVYRAFTSRMIIRKLSRSCGMHVDTVKEALERMREDGVEVVTVQPTHIINGIENDSMLEDVRRCAHMFDRVYVGKPLLSGVEDYKKAVHAVMAEISLAPEEMLILMGHGTDHHANAAYPMLEYTFHALGYENVFVGTVESFPELGHVMAKTAGAAKKKAALMAFMLVAGDHAKNDMAGEEDSWKQALEDAGYEVRVILKGLGELEGIRKIFKEHIESAELS